MGGLWCPPRLVVRGAVGVEGLTLLLEHADLEPNLGAGSRQSVSRLLGSFVDSSLLSLERWLLL